MKRPTFILFSCLAVAGTGWMAHSVWGQPAAATQEKSFTISQSQLDKYVADKVAAAVAAEHSKSGQGVVVSDEQVLKSENWHRAVFNKAEWVVYTGPGQAMFHHWVEQKGAPPAKGGAASPTPPGKGN